VALQNAVDFPGAAERTIVSSGLLSASFLGNVQTALAEFEPVELRDRVTASWEREKRVRTPEEVGALLHDQLPFHFRDPRDPAIAEFERRTAEPVLVLVGRYDRTCQLAGADAIAAGIPNAELVVFERSGHMTYVEENERYVDVVRHFLTDD